MLELRAFMEKGILPRDGGLYAQHFFYVQCMQAIMAGEGDVTTIIKNRGRNSS